MDPPQIAQIASSPQIGPLYVFVERRWKLVPEDNGVWELKFSQEFCVIPNRYFFLFSSTQTNKLEEGQACTGSLALWPCAQHVLRCRLGWWGANPLWCLHGISLEPFRTWFLDVPGWGAVLLPSLLGFFFFYFSQVPSPLFSVLYLQCISTIPKLFMKSTRPMHTMKWETNEGERDGDRHTKMVERMGKDGLWKPASPLWQICTESSVLRREGKLQEVTSDWRQSCS